MPEYLKLPLRFEQFFEKNKLDTCSLKESISRNLHLLITTALGENKQDLKYGAQFWEHDYDIHLSNDNRREIVINSLKRQIAAYEKRLINFSVDVNVKQAEYHMEAGKQLRRRIEIIVSGALIRSNEPFKFQTGFFIGPLSFD
jgi:predicted component of type VI protein secretion system